MNTTKLKAKESILQVEDELLNAMKNCDIQKLDDLLHDELLFNIANGQTITKAMDLDVYSSGNMKISEISASEHQINLIGDNAIVTLTLEMKGTFFDYSLDGKYKIIRVWKSFNDKWKVIAGSSCGLNSNV